MLRYQKAPKSLFIGAWAPFSIPTPAQLVFVIVCLCAPSRVISAELMVYQGPISIDCGVFLTERVAPVLL